MATYRLINSYTVTGSSTASFSFSAIPSTFTDLCLWISAKVDRAGASRSGLRLTFNGNTSNYEWIRFLAYDGNNQIGETQSSQAFIPLIDATANTIDNNIFAQGLFYIAGYQNSTDKTFGSDNGTPNDATTPFIVEWNGGRWSNSAAISSIEISGNTYNFKANTTAYLYGISNA